MQSHPSDSNCPPWCALPICGCAAMLDHASRRRLGRRDIRGLAAREATRALPGRRGCPATLGRRARAATRECKVRESAPPAHHSTLSHPASAYRFQLHTALIASDLSRLQASRDPSGPVAPRGPPARQACVAIQGPWACAATLHRGPRDSDFLPMQNNAGSCECPCILPVGKVCCPSLPGSCGNRAVNESTYCETITILANLL